MLASLSNTHCCSRFGFRDGWLYFIHRGSLYRFSIGDGVVSQRRLETGAWNPIPIFERDTLYRNIVRHRALLPRKKIDSKSNREREMPYAYPETPQNESSRFRHYIIGGWQWLRFCLAAPIEYDAGARRIPCDYFSALALLLAAPKAIDLTYNDPVLAAAVARHWEFPAVEGERWSEISTVVTWKRRRILSWLGYTGGEALANLLRKLIIATNNPLFPLRNCLDVISNPEICLHLARWPRIQRRIIEFLSDERTKTWIDACTIDKLRQRGLPYLTEVLEPINDLVGAKLLDSKGARLTALRKFDHTSCRQLLPILLQHRFPEAPKLSGIDASQIVNADELVSEGETMCHCCGTLQHLTLASIGVVFFYRIMSPTRATLAIRRDFEGLWQVDELRGYSNQQINHVEKARLADSVRAIS